MPSRRFEFPPMSADVFSRLACLPCDEKFILKNQSREIAEIGIGHCENTEPEKTFHTRSFDSAESFSLHPKWEISRRGNHVFVTRNLDADEDFSPDKFRKELDTLLSTSPAIGSEIVPYIPPPQEIGGSWYRPAAQALIDKIHAGKLKKIVLARSIRSRAETPIPVAPILGKLHERFAKNCTIFSITRGGKTFMGASPETLVRLRNGIVETEALAGSVPNFPGADTEALAKQLLADDKERREHRAVIDFIAEKLRRLGLRTEFPETPEIVELPNILHLRTPIRAFANSPVHILDIVSALHPTPAMCGVPTELAREKILKTEPFPRGNFAGPLGFYDSKGEGFFAVGIRCAEICGCEIRLFAGSGLVAGSTPDREFKEIDSKFSAVLSHIQTR